MRRCRFIDNTCRATVIASLAFLWAGCGSGQLPGGSRGGPEMVQGGVIFRYFDPDADKVFIAGDFNNWSARSDPMVDKNGDGEWTLFYTLAPGRYEYKLVVNGVTWVPDPHNPQTVPDGFEGRNSLVVVPRLDS